MIDAEGHFWAGAIFMREHNHVLHDDARGAALGEARALRRDGCSASGFSYVFYIMPPGPAGRGSRRQPARSTASSTTNGTSTSSTTRLRPAGHGAGLEPLARRRRRASSTGSGRTASRPRTLATARRAVRLQTGYVYHYAFAMLIGVAGLVTWYLSCARADPMGDWPLLSLVTFLPLVGAAFIFFIRGEPEIVARNSRSVALWTSLVTFLLSLADLGQFRLRAGRLPAGREEPLAARPRHQLLHGRRRHLALVRAALARCSTLVVVIGSWYSVTSGSRST